MLSLNFKHYFMAISTLLIISCTNGNVDVDMNKRMSESLDDNRTEATELTPLPSLKRR